MLVLYEISGREVHQVGPHRLDQHFAGCKYELGEIRAVDRRQRQPHVIEDGVNTVTFNRSLAAYTSAARESMEDLNSFPQAPI